MFDWLYDPPCLHRSTRPRKRHRRGHRLSRRKDLNLSLALEQLEMRWLLAVDFGDAPDLALGSAVGDYRTLSTDGGPQHTVVSGLFLGGSVDTETEALPSAAAQGDDVDQALPDDEDGLNHPLADLSLTIGAAPTVNVIVTNTTGGGAMLSGWIDYDQDGDFENTTERAQVAVPGGTSGQVVTLTFPVVPSGLTAAPTPAFA